MVLNAVHLDPGDEEHAPTPSLLQVFRITQEVCLLHALVLVHNSPCFGILMIPTGMA